MFSRLCSVAVAGVGAARITIARTESSDGPPLAANEIKWAGTAPKHAQSQNEIITRNSEYCKGIKIYGIGIKEDPVPGEKRGKGKQHLTSSYFIYDLGVFINRNFRAMEAMCRYAHERSEGEGHIPGGWDFRYFMNVSNALFLKAEAEGLRTRDGRDFFLMACWLAMAAAEVDRFPFAKCVFVPVLCVVCSVG